MFCPLAVDWGNAADWVSGIGSLLAVGAALWIAFGQERNARRLRQQARNEEHERKAHLVGEVIRLTAAIEATATAGATLGDLGGGQNGGLMSHKNDIDGLRLQLRALQQFPQTDPRVFGEIGRILHESEWPSGFATGGISYQAIIYRDVAKKLAARREAMVGLLG